MQPLGVIIQIGAMCKNIRFENFYIYKPKRPIEIRVEKTGYSNNNGFRDERGHFDGVVFDDVISNGGRIVIAGYDEEHLIKNVIFKNCINGGQRVSNMDMIKTNEYVKGITFE